MGSEREANIRVRLTANIASGLKSIKQGFNAAGKQAGLDFGASFESGIHRLQHGMKHTFRDIGGIVKMAAPVGGMFAVGEMLKEAVDMQSVYSNLANRANRVAGNTENWESIQKAIAPAVEESGRKAEVMADAFKQVYSETGNLQYAKEIIGHIGIVSVSTGEDVMEVAQAAQLVNRKFGLMGEEAKDALSIMVEKTGVGGAQLGEMTNRFGMMATEAKRAGFEGTEGLSQLMGLMIKLDAQIGEKAPMALKLLFSEFRSGTTQMKRLSRESGGLKFKEGDFFGNMEKILKSKGGMRAAKLTFTGDANTAFTALAEPYQKAFAKAKSENKSMNAAQAEGVAAFRKYVDEMGATKSSAAHSEEIAKKKQTESPKEIVNKAMREVEEAFQNRAFYESLKDLAQQTPKVAHGFVQLMSAMMNHPLLAAGGAVGLKMAVDFSSGVIGKAASGMSTEFMKGVTTSFASLMMPVGTGIGTAMGAAAQAALVGGAGVLGFMLGKYMAESMMEHQNKKLKEASSADMTATNAVNDKETSTADLEAQLKVVRSKKKDLDAFGFSDIAAGVGRFWAGNGKEGQAEMDYARKQTHDIPLQQLTDTENAIKAEIERRKVLTSAMSDFHESTLDATKAMRMLGSLAPGGGGPTSTPRAGLSTTPGFNFSPAR